MHRSPPPSTVVDRPQMAKGDDALRRKKNKVIRKRLRNSESSVTARVAAIIASKRRRKAGKRRICEGMCFSLPTEDDPFNERQEKRKKAMEKKIDSKNKKLNKKDNKQSNTDLVRDTKHQQRLDCDSNKEERLLKNPIEKTEGNIVSKFLLLCLRAIEDTWLEEGTLNKGMAGTLLSNSWGVDFCKGCSSGSSAVVIGEASATRDQVAWLVSTVVDIITRKEKQGIVVPSPFLLFLVSSRDRAVEVRSLCKPLKDLGIHTVSLHPGASLVHQIQGLKNYEPEFLVSTPERLLELVSLNAIDISGTSVLVLDGLTKFDDLGLLDRVRSIRDCISGDPQIITFSDGYEKVSITMLLKSLVRGSVYRLSSQESVASLISSASQYIHFYLSEKEKLSKVIQILAKAFDNQTAPSSKVLLIAGTTCKTDTLLSSLKSNGYDAPVDSHKSCLHKIHGKKSGTIMVKDMENIHDLKMDEFEFVIFVDFPPTVEDYTSVLLKIARHALSGVLHSFFSAANASSAQLLIDVLEQCGQKVPEFLRNFQSSNSSG